MYIRLYIRLILITDVPRMEDMLHTFYSFALKNFGKRFLIFAGIYFGHESQQKLLKGKANIF